MSEILNLLLRTTLIFIILVILARLLGKKQMSHLTFFNYVTGITIGSIAANIISKGTEPYKEDLIGLIWWCFLTFIVGLINLKSGKLRRIIDGEPSILIKRGIIDRKTLKKTGINLDDVSMMLREKDIFSLAEVDYAILEPNGRFSVLKKQPQQSPTKGDLNIPPQSTDYLPSEIIVDGKIIKQNLTENNLDSHWLKQQLIQQNISSEKDVLYAELQSDGSLYIQKNN